MASNIIINNNQVVSRADLEQAGIVALLKLLKNPPSGMTKNYVLRSIKRALVDEVSRFCGAITTNRRVKATINKILRLKNRNVDNQTICQILNIQQHKIETYLRLARSVDDIYRTETPLSGDIYSIVWMLEEYYGLSELECNVAKMMINNYSDLDIQHRLSISRHALNKVRRSIYDRLVPV